MAKKKTKKKAKRKKTPLKLFVVFDTNVLHTQVASDLVNAEVSKLIKANSSHSDILLKWYLPSVVIDERRYQMQTKAFGLLPSIQRLERLLGHNLNITKDILIQRVDVATQSKLTELNLLALPIDINRVEWSGLIERASFRKAPFESGEKEKGFRDSIIAESFFQLISDSAKSPSICRLVFVTGDNLLSKFIQEKTNDKKNVYILSSCNELESLINTLVSKVTEEFVSNIKTKASKYFFEKENYDTLYYKENIYDKITKQYSKELNYRPIGISTRENISWWINNPVFLKKIRQRVFWTTQITVNYKLYEYQRESALDTNPVSGNWDLSGSVLIDQSLGNNFFISPKIQQTTLQGTLGYPLINSEWFTPELPPIQKKEVGKGKTKFEVYWSINVTRTHKLTLPKVTEIKFIEHTN